MPASSCRKTFLLTLLTAATASADTVDVVVNHRALIGRPPPLSVNVHILEPIAGFELKLKRSDGKDVVIRGGGQPGQTRVLELNQPEGKFSYTGELKINLPDASTGKIPMQFDAELFAPLRMKLEKTDVDLEGRKATFRLSRPAEKAKVSVLMDTGRMAMDEEVMFKGEPADTPLTVSWPEANGKVMKISIQAYDTSTFFTGVELYPWRIDIPHEEIHFDSGKWVVREQEETKLDSSLNLIAEELRKYGRLADIKLYIAGHTDTVGPKPYNRNLSVNRAKAIGGYFRKRGLKIPVFYDGLGEEALLQPTADEVDEKKNRRAEYILAIEPPSSANLPVALKWRKL
jgi:outer membrane protein OmpA-like peptidoglycan-associated protein